MTLTYSRKKIESRDIYRIYVSKLTVNILSNITDLWKRKFFHVISTAIFAYPLTYCQGWEFCIGRNDTRKNSLIRDRELYSLHNSIATSIFGKTILTKLALVLDWKVKEYSKYIRHLVRTGSSVKIEWHRRRQALRDRNKRKIRQYRITFNDLKKHNIYLPTLWSVHILWAQDCNWIN